MLRYDAQIPNAQSKKKIASVGGGSRVRGCGKTDTVVGGIENRVEALEESVAIDEVETFTTGGAKGVDNEVDVARATTNISVKGARPDLAVRGESVGGAANIEVQVLEGTVLGGGNAEKASRPVQSSTSCSLVLCVGIAGDEDKGSASVNDTSRLRQDGRGAVSDALVDTPVVGCRVGGGERSVCNGAGVLGSVSSTEGELSIGV